MAVVLLERPRTIVRPYAATIVESDLCRCGWSAGQHRLFGGVINHVYVHINHES